MDTTAPKESSNSQRTGVPSSPGKFCGSCASSGGDSGLSEYSSAGDVKGEDDKTPGSSGCDIAKDVMVEVVAGSKSWTPSRTDSRAWQAQAGQYDALHATSARLARLAVVTPPRVLAPLSPVRSSSSTTRCSVNTLRSRDVRLSKRQDNAGYTV